MRSIRSSIAQHRRLSGALLLITCVLPVMSYEATGRVSNTKGPGLADHNQGQRTAPSSKVKKQRQRTAASPKVPLAITAINGVPVRRGVEPEVGLQVKVEGTVSDPNRILCVLVHPLSGDTWWVQNPPSPPDQVKAQIWRWRTVVFCGTPELGRREEYEIVALTESDRSVCQLAKRIKSDQFPRELPRSEIITVRRVRN